MTADEKEIRFKVKQAFEVTGATMLTRAMVERHVMSNSIKARARDEVFHRMVVDGTIKLVEKTTSTYRGYSATVQLMEYQVKK